MIDLSAMNEVTVDPGSRRARVGGGALLYDLDFASLRHGLATTAGIVSHTGVGGLTLGGGYGRLGRKLGLTIDSLLAAELVCADGRTRRLSADENKDLFWAIRGGGGNFGVVTEFEFALHEVPPEMYGGVIQWPLAAARDVLQYYAEHSPGFSDEMFVAPGMTTAADGSARLAIDICYCGDPRNAERELAPLRAVARPAIDGAVPTAYLTMQTRMDGVARPGIRSYIKSGMVGAFTPALIDTMLDGFEPGQGFVINSFATGGRIAQVAETATAWPHRNAHSMIAAVAFWSDAGADSARIGAVRSLWSKLEPHVGGYYANIQARRHRSGRKLRARVPAARVDQERLRSDEPVPTQQQHSADCLSYHTSQRSAFGRTMASPALQLNALLNSGRFDSGPLTRNFAIGCGSP